MSTSVLEKTIFIFYIINNFFLKNLVKIDRINFVFNMRIILELK